MSRHDSAPTHGYVILSRINRYLSGLFLFLIFVIIIVVSSITYAIRRDCNQPYHRDLKLGGYWIKVSSGSTELGCADER